MGEARRSVSSSQEDCCLQNEFGTLSLGASSVFVALGHVGEFWVVAALPPFLLVSSLSHLTAAPHHLHLLTLFSSFQASKAWRKNKMDESKHEIHSQVDAITAGTASVVNLTAGRAAVQHLSAEGFGLSLSSLWPSNT